MVVSLDVGSYFNFLVSIEARFMSKYVVHFGGTEKVFLLCLGEISVNIC